jgi:hypothetical protein
MIVLGIAFASVVEIFLAGGGMAVGAALLRCFGVLGLSVRIHGGKAQTGEEQRGRDGDFKN